MNNKRLVALGIFLLVTAILAGVIYFRMPWPKEHLPFWALGLIAMIIGWSMGMFGGIVFPYSDYGYGFGTRLILQLLMACTMIFLVITTIMVFPLQAQ